MSILGIATAYPTNLTRPDDLEAFAKKFCDDNEGLEKTLLVNRNSKILTRPMVQTTKSPLINSKTPPTIKAVNKLFMDQGVKLGVEAGRKAIWDWGGEVGEITHLICNTCTASSYPGYDHSILMALGLPLTTDRTLLHGVGCAGGLSALRLARQLSLIPTSTGLPARILVIAVEITSTLCRSEIDEISRLDDGRANVSLCLFSDGASAMIVGGGELRGDERASFELVEAVTETIPNTVADLGFNVDEFGWKAIISSKVPMLTSKSVPPLFSRLLSLPSLPPSAAYLSSPASSTPAPSLDWLIHPGGSLILSKLEFTLQLSAADHTKASWEVYKHRGNTSSASIGAVVEMSRGWGGREGCVAVAFGPGVTVEMVLMRRTGWRGREVEGVEGVTGGVGELKVNGNGNGH